MVRTIIDIINLSFSASSFLVSLILFTVLSIVFAKSIKKHASILYWVFGVMALLYALPMLLGGFDIQIPFNFSSIPVLNVILREFSSAAYFIHPLIVIIMYMGALKFKTPYVAKLMSIRKELSIIVGFSVIAHAIKRIMYTFPGAWSYFADNEAYIAEREVTSVLGSTITNFVFVLGIVMTVLFLVLWVTSFDSVRRKMGNIKWKKVQKWSYVLYAMLFIHSTGIYAGGLISRSAKERIEQQQTQSSDVAKSTSVIVSNNNKPEGAENKVSTANVAKKTTAVKAEKHKSKPKRFYLDDVEVTRTFKSYFNISLYILIYGSYLYLRIRKAKRDKRRKKS